MTQRLARFLIAALLVVVAAGVVSWRTASAQSPSVLATLAVFSDCSGRPLPGVEVDANGTFIGYTDAAGRLSGSVLPGVSYTLTLYDAYYRTPWHGSFATDGPITLTVVLHRIGPGC